MRILSAILFSALFCFWLSTLQFSSAPVPANTHHVEPQLYGNDFDDPEGAAAYNFKRLRNPLTGEVPRDIRKKELAFAATLPQQNVSRAEQWQNRGPYNLGGRTRALAIDVTDENIILAGQVSGGMWRSIDGGQHFTKCTQPQQIHSTTCVVQDRRSGHTNTWYYGTGEHYGIVNAAGFSSQLSGDGIFKSTDGGVTWNQLQSTVSGTAATLYQKRDFDFVWDMVTDPSNAAEEEVYAAVINGIWRSADGGSTWTPALGLDTSIAQISQYSDVAITSTGVLYATISSETPSKGIWRSDDGITWKKITPGGFPSSYNRIEIGIAPSDETQVYFIAHTPGSGAVSHNFWHYKYNSGDGSGAGGTWTNRTTNLPNDHCTGYFTFDFAKFSTQSSYDMFVAVHPTDPNLVFLGGTNIYRSYNGFSTPAYDWIGGYQCDSTDKSNYVYPNHHSDQHKLLFLPSNSNKALSANDGGLMRTDDITGSTVTWQLMNNDYNTGQFYTVAIQPGNTDDQTIIGGLQDNGTFVTYTQDYTKPWYKSFIGDGGYCAIGRNHSAYYMSWQTGKIYKLDTADHYTNPHQTRIDPTGGSGALFIAPLILDPLDDNIMYFACGRSIWRNDSLSAIPITGNIYNTISQGWTKLTGTNLGVGIASPNASSLDISEADQHKLFFGTDQGKVYRLDSCRTNTTTKVDITGANFPGGAYVSCVEVDRTNTNNILVTFSNYGIPSVFYTTDGGASWTDVSGNLEQNANGSGHGPSVTWGHIYKDGTNTKFFVGTSIGLFSTETLNGANTVWAQEGASTIGNVVINMISSRVYDGNIVVATHGNGIYSNKIFTPSGVQEISNGDQKLHCYPNPFTDRVSIQAPQGQNDVVIYDLNGAAIRRMKMTSAQAAWDGRDDRGAEVAKGTYVVISTNGGKRHVGKIVKL